MMALAICARRRRPPPAHGARDSPTTRILPWPAKRFSISAASALDLLGIVRDVGIDPFVDLPEAAQQAGHRGMRSSTHASSMAGTSARRRPAPARRSTSDSRRSPAIPQRCGGRDRHSRPSSCATCPHRRRRRAARPRAVAHALDHLQAGGLRSLVKNGTPGRAIPALSSPRCQCSWPSMWAWSLPTLVRVAATIQRARLVVTPAHAGLQGRPGHPYFSNRLSAIRMETS